MPPNEPRPPYAADRLARELIAAGIPRAAFCGFRAGPRGADGGLPRERWMVDWVGDPTPAQLATAAAVLAAHDPDGDAKDAAAALVVARDRRTALYADWVAAAPGIQRRMIGALLAMHDDRWPEVKP